MRRAIAALFVAALAVAGSGVPSVAVPPDSDSRGPACTNIADGNLLYDGTSVAVQMLLAVPGCAQFDYSVQVFTADGNGDFTVLAGSQTLSGDQSTPFNEFHQLVFSVPVSGSPSEVCISGATTSPGGRHVFDLAPDTGCIVTIVDAPPAGSRFR